MYGNVLNLISKGSRARGGKRSWWMGISAWMRVVCSGVLHIAFEEHREMM